MKTKVINDITYYVIKDDNDILSNMDISEKLTEYFDDFDYIVGDISYSVIRLKGFYRDSKSNNKFNKITNDSGTLKLSDSPLTQYRKIGNVCTLKVSNYTPLSVNAYANLTIGTLPENFRPLIYLAQPVAIKGSNNNALNGILLTIAVNGTVRLQNWTGATINIAGLEGYIAYLTSNSNIETTSNASTVSNDEPISEEATI